MDIESSRSEKWNENLFHSFREVKSEMKIWFTLFEKWKVKWKSDSLFSRNEKWNKNLIHSFREVKSEMKMPRDRDQEVKFLENSSEILEKFLRIKTSRKLSNTFTLEWRIQQKAIPEPICHSPSNPSQLIAFEHLIQISEAFKPVSYSLWQSVHCWKMNDRESQLWKRCILVLYIIEKLEFFTLFFSRKRVKSEMLSLFSRIEKWI